MEINFAAGHVDNSGQGGRIVPLVGSTGGESMAGKVTIRRLPKLLFRHEDGNG